MMEIRADAWTLLFIGAVLGALALIWMAGEFATWLERSRNLTGTIMNEKPVALETLALVAVSLRLGRHVGLHRRHRVPIVEARLVMTYCKIPSWCRLLMTRDWWTWLAPRWCRLLVLEAALIGVVSGYSYAVHQRQPEPLPSVPDYVWLDLAADAAAEARKIVDAANALQILAGVEPE